MQSVHPMFTYETCVGDTVGSHRDLAHSCIFHGFNHQMEEGVQQPREKCFDCSCRCCCFLIWSRTANGLDVPCVNLTKEFLQAEQGYVDLKLLACLF